MEIAIAGESFHSCDLGSMCTRRGNETCHDCFAVKEYGAGATFAFGTTFFRADQITFFAQQSQQRFVMPAGEGIFLSIYCGLNWGEGELVRLWNFSIRLIF